MTEQPELFAPALRCPHKGCRRTLQGPYRYGLTDFYRCSAKHESYAPSTKAKA